MYGLCKCKSSFTNERKNGILKEVDTGVEKE